MPVVLTPSMSHLDLAQAFAKVRTEREVWVYDKGSVIQGSPFGSYADICSIIGVEIKSKIVQRYIDTGK